MSEKVQCYQIQLLVTDVQSCLERLMTKGTAMEAKEVTDFCPTIILVMILFKIRGQK